MDESRFPPDLYTIRLAGPWSLEQDGLNPQRIQLPCNPPALHDIGVNPAAPLAITRRFHKPSGLESIDRVLLILASNAHPARATLNGLSIESARRMGDAIALELTAALQDSNLLNLEFNPQPRFPDLGKPVLLGIMPDADQSWWRSLDTL